MRAAREAGLSDEAMERLSWIAYFVEHHGSIGDTCARFGISRSTLHRWLERFDAANLQTLEEGSHVPHGVRQPTVPAHVIALIRTYREQWPLIGKEKVSKLLQNEHGIAISASSVGRVIERECLYFGNTPLHWRKRMEGKSEAPGAETVREAFVIARRGTDMPGPKTWRRAMVAVSVAAHLIALTFGAALLMESLQATEKTKAAVSGQILQSNISQLLSADE